MRHFTCPRCHNETIPLKDKYRASYWINIYCAGCGARLAANPYLMSLLWGVYVWDVVWFYGLWHFIGNPIYFLWMVVGWLFLDVMNVMFMPFVVLRKRE